jgi:hypothetical protein
MEHTNTAPASGREWFNPPKIGSAWLHVDPRYAVTVEAVAHVDPGYVIVSVSPQLEGADPFAHCRRVFTFKEWAAECEPLKGSASEIERVRAS